MPISRVLRFAGRLLLALSLVTLLAGCEEDVKLNPEFSLNLLEPGPKYPKEKNLTPAQKEAFEKYGKPDRLRIQWGPDGQIMGRDELRQKFQGKKKPEKLPPCFWVYERRGIELAFDGDTFREVPLTDQVKMVLRHGDPEDVKLLADGVVQWTFYSTGRMVKFAGGRIVEEREFPAMGRYIK